MLTVGPSRLLAAPLLALAASTEPPQVAVTQFGSSTQLVQLTVYVTDKEGHGVAGLRKDDFSAADNDRSQPITFFQSANPPDDPPPSTIGPGQANGSAAAPASSAGAPHYLLILLEPMGFEARHRAIAATERFLRRLVSSDAYEVALIDARRLAQQFTRDIPGALRTLETDIGAKGNPGPFDGLDGSWLRLSIDVLNALMPKPGRKSMVWFVDYDLKIWRDFPVLMVESNRGVYVLGYDLTHKMADGRWHKVRVKVTRDDLDVHAKEGYVAPKAP